MQNKFGLERLDEEVEFEDVEDEEVVDTGVYYGVTPKKIRSLRARMRGVNVSVQGREFPRVSERHFEQLVASMDEANDDILTYSLSRFCKPGTNTWKDYMALRGGRRVQRSDGRGNYEVVKSLAPRYIPPHELARLDAVAKMDKARGRDGKVKRYTLAQVLSDTYIRDKYEIPIKLLRSVQRMAVTTPADAAATIEDFFQKKSSKGIRIKVTAASYADGVNAAKRSIERLAITVPEPQLDIPCSIIGSQMFVYGDLSDVPWYVRGPVSYASTVMHVYRLASHGGCHHAIHLFALETAKLKIDIFIDDDKTGVFRCVCPTIVGHVGSPKDRILESVGMEMDLGDVALERLRDVKKNLMSIRDNGKHVATAVQVERRTALVNQHVLDFTSGVLEVEGKTMQHPVVIGVDVWAVKCERECSPWSFRDPVVGEYACVFFHNGERAVLSPKFRIRTVDGVRVMSEKVPGVTVGTSGGALVAVSDFSLLGIHCGESIDALMATRFSQTMYEDLVQFSSSASDSRFTDATSSDAIVELFRSRGMGKQFSGIVKALRPVTVDDRAVATAVQVSPDSAYSVADGMIGTSRTHRNGLLTEARVRGKHVVPVVRSPQLYENVVLIGIDDEGPYSTTQLRVKQVGPGARNFFVTAPEAAVFSLVGAVVVSVQDCTVLGVVVRSASNPGCQSHMMCVTLPEIVQPDVDLVTELERIFPLLSVREWPRERLEEVFTHKSLSDAHNNGPLSRIGDAYIKYELLKSLMASSEPQHDWQEYVTRLQNNHRLSALAEELGLARLLRVGSGVHLTTGSKAYADMMEALCALVQECEPENVALQWLDAVGIVPYPGSFKGPEFDYTKLMRRPSELGLLGDDGMLYPVD